MLGRTEYMMIPQSNNSSLQSISREVQYAWLAGIIDGEANLSASTHTRDNGKKYLNVKLRISNTDLRMIRRIAEIYARDNVVFFYTINKRRRYNKKWKDQLHIEVASHGSVKKVLSKTIPYLVNKKNLADIVLRMIDFVQSQRKGGRMTPKDKLVDYANLPGFIALMDQYDAERKFYVDPSTTKRRASEVFTW